MDLRRLDLDQRDDAAAETLLYLDHARQQWIPHVDQVVTEQNREGLVADVLRGDQHGVPKPRGSPWRT